MAKKSKKDQSKQSKKNESDLSSSQKAVDDISEVEKLYSTENVLKAMNASLEEIRKTSTPQSLLPVTDGDYKNFETETYLTAKMEKIRLAEDFGDNIMDEEIASSEYYENPAIRRANQEFEKLRPEIDAFLRDEYPDADNAALRLRATFNRPAFFDLFKDTTSAQDKEKILFREKLRAMNLQEQDLQLFEGKNVELLSEPDFEFLIENSSLPTDKKTAIRALFKTDRALLQKRINPLHIEIINKLLPIQDKTEINLQETLGMLEEEVDTLRKKSMTNPKGLFEKMFNFSGEKFDFLSRRGLNFFLKQEKKTSIDELDPVDPKTNYKEYVENRDLKYIMKNGQHLPDKDKIIDEVMSDPKFNPDTFRGLINQYRTEEAKNAPKDLPYMYKGEFYRRALVPEPSEETVEQKEPEVAKEQKSWLEEIFDVKKPTEKVAKETIQSEVIKKNILKYPKDDKALLIENMAKIEDVRRKMDLRDVKNLIPQILELTGKADVPVTKSVLSPAAKKSQEQYKKELEAENEDLKKQMANNVDARLKDSTLSAKEKYAIKAKQLAYNAMLVSRTAKLLAENRAENIESIVDEAEQSVKESYDKVDQEIEEMVQNLTPEEFNKVYLEAKVENSVLKESMFEVFNKVYDNKAAVVQVPIQTVDGVVMRDHHSKPTVKDSAVNYLKPGAVDTVKAAEMALNKVINEFKNVKTEGIEDEMPEEVIKLNRTDEKNEIKLPQIDNLENDPYAAFRPLVQRYIDERQIYLRMRMGVKSGRKGRSPIFINAMTDEYYFYKVINADMDVVGSTFTLNNNSFMSPKYVSKNYLKPFRRIDHVTDKFLETRTRYTTREKVGKQALGEKMRISYGRLDNALKVFSWARKYRHLY